MHAFPVLTFLVITLGVKREPGKPKESVRTRCLNELVSAVKQREERKQEQSDENQDTKPVSGKPFTKYQVRNQLLTLSISRAHLYTRPQLFRGNARFQRFSLHEFG